MMRTGTFASWRVAASDVLTRARFLTGREVLLAAIAGVASAVISQFAGRAMHAAWPIPASGSLVTALPRAVILLALLARVNRFGVLTTAAVAELAAKAALGGVGAMPWSLAVPVIGNLAGDVAWAGLRGLPSRSLRLILTGACLCTARVLAALLFWSLFLATARRSLGPVHGLIVAANAISGLLGGLIVIWPASRKRQGEKYDKHQ